MRDRIEGWLGLAVFAAWKLLLAVFMYAEEPLPWRECWRRAAEPIPKGGW